MEENMERLQRCVEKLSETTQKNRTDIEVLFTKFDNMIDTIGNMRKDTASAKKAQWGIFVLVFGGLLGFFIEKIGG